MRQNSWSKKEEDYLREHYPDGDTRAIAEALGRTYKATKSRAKVLKIQKAKGRHFWTDAELETLHREYPDTKTDELADHLGLTTEQVYSKVSQLGLTKSDAYHESGLSGRITKENAEERGGEFRFKKGQPGWNKGKSMPVVGRMAETQFKKGSVPHNAKPVGTETVTDDGYIKIKTADPNEWEFKHRLVWEDANGPVPEGMAIYFKNKDKTDIRLDNLEIIKRSELLNRNFLCYPKEIKDAIRAVNKMKRRIRNAEKQNVGSSQPSV